MKVCLPLSMFTTIFKVREGTPYFVLGASVFFLGDIDGIVSYAAPVLIEKRVFRIL